MIPSFVDKEKIPHKPGIYMYKDSTGKVIYVGKAIDLYNRVSSYFRGYEESSSAYFSGAHNTKTMQLVSNIADLETIIVESELEALILEANLIKKFLPHYNIRLTDDKDYLYIAVTKEDFPQVITARKKDLRPISTRFALRSNKIVSHARGSLHFASQNVKHFFGPFPSSKTVKATLKQLRRVFPWCSAPQRDILKAQKNECFLDSGTNSATIAKTRRKSCFYYHLKLCPGACIGAISKEDYKKIINQFVKFMDGRKDELLEELQKEMEDKSKNLEFEEAAKIKRIIAGITYMLQPNRVSSYLENPNFLEDENKIGIEELKRVLNLPELPERIEGYDISNFQGQESTGSMVVLTNGEIDKSQYRRFKIKITGKPNDYGMHEEMMGRRLKNSWPLPQLFIIDGGRGQVRAAQKKLLEKGINTPVFGLAKRMEWLYPPEGEVIKLPKRSLSLRLLQKLRDESHRFAVSYHRKLRNELFRNQMKEH